jgi:hypothetical protein
MVFLLFHSGPLSLCQFKVMFYIYAKLHKFQSTKFCLAACDIVSVSLHTKLCVITQGLSRFTVHCRVVGLCMEFIACYPSGTWILTMALEFWKMWAPAFVNNPRCTQLTALNKCCTCSVTWLVCHHFCFVTQCFLKLSAHFCSADGSQHLVIT